MAKSTTQFVCSECGASSPKWLGRCPSCGKFNTMLEETVTSATGPKVSSPSSRGSVRAQRLESVSFDESKRISTGLSEFDTVLGGGIVKGSLILLGGEPGIGKSTLLTQIAANLSKSAKILYLSAEESCSQVKMRTERLNLETGEFYILNETCIDDMESELLNADFCIIDSIQAVYTDDLSSSSGSVSQVRECATRFMRIAKTRGITFFIISHVTKDGSIAGPKVLEHIMDVVLYFEGESVEDLRILRAVKNRFGNISEVGVFEMCDDGVKELDDYSSIFLSDDRGAEPGSAVTPVQTGARAMNVEIQTLVSKTSFGIPRRMAVGIDFNKLALMTAVLEKKCGLYFGSSDIYINAMGGMKIAEPAADLAICAALASSYYGKPVDSSVVAFGEVGLTGEVRAVSHCEARVAEAIRMGFERVLLPAKSLRTVSKYRDKIDIVAVQHVNAMIKILFKAE